MVKQKKHMKALDFTRKVMELHVNNTLEFFRNLFPRYEFFHHWEIINKDEMVEVVRVCKYWLGVELERREYILKENSVKPEEQQEAIRQHIKMIKHMYDELPPELQKEISG